MSILFWLLENPPPPCFSYECEGEGVTGKGVRKMLILKGRFGGLTACRSKRARFA
jgi:hypothetical protein